MQALSRLERRLSRQLLTVLQSNYRSATPKTLVSAKEVLTCTACGRAIHNSSIRYAEKSKQQDSELKEVEDEVDQEDLSANISNQKAEIIDQNERTRDEVPDIQRRVLPKFAKTLEERGIHVAEEIFHVAEKSRGKSRETFNIAVEHFIDCSGKYRRGHIEFVETATEKMTEYNLHRDIETYKKLFTLFPEGAYIPPTAVLEEFYYMPRHQDAAIMILEKMENNDLIPDEELGDMIEERFSYRSQPMRKYRRMLYWMTKFAHVNPWPILYDNPTDQIELAKLILKRISHDINAKIDVWKSEEISHLQENQEDTYIASSQSPGQQELLAAHPVNQPLYVVGGNYVYFGRDKLQYYVLKSGAPPEGAEYYGMAKDERPIEADRTIEEIREDVFNEYNFSWNFLQDEDQTAIMPEITVNEQEDGSVMSMCITGTSSQNSLVTWLRCLERTNPILDRVTVVFQLQDPDELLKNTEKEESEKS